MFLRTVGLLIVLSVLSACGATTIVPVAGELGEASGFIADASTAKEGIVHKTWQAYYEEMGWAYAESGFEMEYAMQNINGMQAYLPSKISFRDTPKMAAPPKEPSKHPVWGTIRDVVKTVSPWVGGYYIAEGLFGTFKGMSDNAGNHYNGPVQMTGSYNTAGRDQTLTLENLHNKGQPETSVSEEENSVPEEE